MTHVEKTVGIHEHGWWIEPHPTLYHQDPCLAAYLAEVVFMPGETIADFGCGSGYYVTFLRRRGFEVTGFDGNPETAKIEGCRVADLAVKQDLGHWDWVLSLEVGEHIPEEFAGTFFDNLVSHGRRILLSWAVPGHAGHGHFNCRPNGWVVEQMASRGYSPIGGWDEIRKHCLMPYLQETLMIYE